MNQKIVFHGTNEPDFNYFSNDKIGQGGDPNSVLGIFMAESPIHASEYGEYIIVCAVKQSLTKMYDLEHNIFSSEVIEKAHTYYRQENNSDIPNKIPDFFENPDDYRVFCCAAREVLLEKKVTCIEYSGIGSDDPVCVVLNSQDIEILTVLTQEEALKLDELYHNMNDFYDQEQRYLLLEKVVNERINSSKLNTLQKLK